MGAQALQNSQPLMLHASLSRQSAMVLTMVVAVSPWGMILHPSIIVFSFSYEVPSKFALVGLSMYWGVHRMLAVA